MVWRRLARKRIWPGGHQARVRVVSSETFTVMSLDVGLVFRKKTSRSFMRASRGDDPCGAGDLEGVWFLGHAAKRVPRRSYAVLEEGKKAAASLPSPSRLGPRSPRATAGAGFFEGDVPYEGLVMP